MNESRKQQSLLNTYRLNLNKNADPYGTTQSDKEFLKWVSQDHLIEQSEMWFRILARLLFQRLNLEQLNELRLL